MHMSATSFKLTSDFGADSFCCCGDAWLGFRGDKEVFCKKRGKESVIIQDFKLSQ
jgi:hypothetical protein